MDLVNLVWLFQAYIPIAQNIFEEVFTDQESGGRKRTRKTLPGALDIGT